MTTCGRDMRHSPSRIFRVLRSRSRCPRVASRFEYTAVGVPVMSGESPTARIQSAVGLEPDARNDPDHAFAKMSTGIPHLPLRDKDARAVSLGAFGLQVTSLLAFGGYGVEWVASPGVSDLPPLVPKAPLQEGTRVVLDQPSLDGVNLPPLGLRALYFAFGSGVTEGRHGGSFPGRRRGYESELTGCFRPVFG